MQSKRYFFFELLINHVWKFKMENALFRSDIYVYIALTTEKPNKFDLIISLRKH